MKKILLIPIILIALLTSCTDEYAFKKGKSQLEMQGYTNVCSTGYEYLCCGNDDTFSEGFQCKDKDWNLISGCFCSGIFKGVTIRFK